MAEERINDIIAQEAFDQLAEFGKALNALNEKMKEIIGTADEVKKAMSSATGFKDVADATSKANDVAKEYVETTRKSQEVHAKMKSTFEGVMSSVDKYDKAIDGAREAMRSAREETGQLLLRVIDERAAVEASSKSRKEQNKLLKESQADLKEAKTALDGYVAKEKSIRDTIAATSAEMEREKEANGENSARYSELAQKMESYQMMLESNVSEQQKYLEIMNAAQQAVDKHKDRLVDLEIAERQHKASMSEAQLAAKQSLDIEQQQAGSINELRKRLSQYTSAYNALSEEERENIEIGVPLAEGMNAIKERLRELNNEQKNAGFAEGSYRQLNAELGELRNQYKALSEAERENDEIGGALQQRIMELDTKLKALDKGIGQNQRTVGDYTMILDRVMNGEVSIRNAMRTMSIELNKNELRRRGLTDSIKEQEKAVQELRRTEGEGSAAYTEAVQKLDQMNAEYAEVTSKVNDLTDKLGNLKDVQADISRATQGMAADAGNVKAAVEGVGLLTNVYSVLQAGTVALGADSQALADIYNKVMVLQNGLNSINKIADALQRESILRVRARAALDKLRLAYTQALAAETAKKTAIETTETAATTANTVAEKTNTAAKAGNTVATTGAAAATTALAAGEGVATAASFSLTAALKTVGVAIKSIPVIGWILAAIAGLATLGKIVYNMITAEKELTAEQQRRQEVIKATNEAKAQAVSNTQKEFIELDRNVAKLHELKEGSEEYNKTVEAVAKQLGVSDKWLKSNIAKVDQLKDAWKRVRLAQAVADGLIAKAADAQVKAEEEILALREKSYKERKKELREQGYSRRDARSAAQQSNLATTEAAIRARAAQTSKDLVAQADRVEKEMEADMQLVNAAQKEAAQESERTTSSTINKQKSDAESAMEYYKGIIKSMADEENKQLSKTAKGRLELLNKQQAAEAAKYRIATTLSQEERLKIEEYYEHKRAEIRMEEAERQRKAISAAYAVQVESRLKMLEMEYEQEGLKGKELSTLLIAVEDERYALAKKKRAEAQLAKLKDLEVGSAEYAAVLKAGYAEEELAEEEHQQRIRAIKKSGIDQQLADVKAQYDDLRNILIAEGGGVMSASDELRIQREEAVSQLLQFEEEKAQILADGLMTEEEYERKLHELKANAAKSERSLNEERKESIMTVASITVDAFNSIAGSIKGMLGDSVNAVIAQQALSLAQVYMEQGVAIASAIRLAFEDKSNVTWYEAAAKAVASVALVVGETVAAFKAVKEAKKASARAQVSAYAEGTTHHQGGDAVVGEGGSPELVTVAGRNYLIDKPTLIKDLPVGAKVTPLDTRSLDNYPQVDLTEVLASMDDLKRREHVHIDVGKNVYSYIVNGASRARILNSKFAH